MSPVENALKTIVQKNEELREIIDQYDHSERKQNINPFTMALNGVIDAAVNGGVGKYSEVFFAPGEEDNNKLPKPSASI